MEIPYRLPILRVLTLIALALSTAMLVDGLQSESRLCAFDLGCDLVVNSSFAKPLGVPLPVLGVLAFAVVFGLSLTPGGLPRRTMLVFALVAGAGGWCLLAVQLLILEQVCPFCLVIDILAVLIATLAICRDRPGLLPEPPAKGRLLWLGTALGVLSLGVVLGSVQFEASRKEKTPVPPQVAALWAPDKVNVVEISDFQCPHCRQLHPVLMSFLETQGDRVRHVLLTIPMPAHKQARDASLAYLCAEKQGKGPAMAEQLIVARSLAPSICEGIAGFLGLSMPAYHACLVDPEMARKLDSDLVWVKEAHPEGLPIIWVQDQKFAGLKPEKARTTLRAAVEKALRYLDRR